MYTGFAQNKVKLFIILLAAAFVTQPFLFLTMNRTAAVPAVINMKYALLDKSVLAIGMNAVNPHVRMLAADDGNHLLLEICVRDANGAAVQGAEVSLAAAAAGAGTGRGAAAYAKSGSMGISGRDAGIQPDSAAVGRFEPAQGFTDSGGFFYSSYIPPSFLPTRDSQKRNNSSHTDSPGAQTAVPGSPKPGSRAMQLTARLSGTEKNSSLQINLVPVPVVLIHGYQATPDIFSGLSAFLREQGFQPLAFSYPSEKGVAESASRLSGFLEKKRRELDSAGIQTGRFDLIAHSMGGLVARYYTCGKDYPQKGNVRKLIFLSVPQNGSPFATLGLRYYNDSGIHDLAPESSLYSTIFPSMINKGLNPSIQTGNLLGRYDEVVGLDSASLESWKIQSELFDLGDSNFTLGKLLNGQILQAANHKLILYNSRVYDRILQILKSNIPYPSIK